MDKKKKILITGPVPPPAGGISIHIWRLKNLLQDDFSIDFIDESSIKKNGIFNLRSFNPFTYLKKIIQADLVYVQSGSTFLRLFQLFISKLFFKKIILTIHAYPFQKKRLLFFLDNSIFNFAKKIIVVNKDIISRLSLPPGKCVIKNAFLPPDMPNEPTLPELVTDILTNAKASDKKIICANASRLDIYNNEDLYGLDMCIEMAKRLVKKEMKFIFIFVVSSLDDSKNIYENYQEQIKKEGLENHFILINIILPFVRLIEQADLIVRPTNTDGDAITVRETLYLGKPILASDAAARPEGTLLFRNRDFDDFEQKLVSFLNKNDTGILIPEKNRTESYSEYKSFYTDLINSVILN